MKEKLRVMLADNFDEELNAMSVVVTVLKPLTWDQKWRVLNYVLVRMLGHRGWGLNRPNSDKEEVK